MAKRITAFIVLAAGLFVFVSSAFFLVSCSNEFPGMVGTQALDTTNFTAFDIDTGFFLESDLSITDDETVTEPSDVICDQTDSDSLSDSLNSDLPASSQPSFSSSDADSKVPVTNDTSRTADSTASADHRVTTAPAGNDEPSPVRTVGIDKALSRSLSYLRSSESDPGYGSEWIVLALEKGGAMSGAMRSAYISSVTSSVSEKLAQNTDSPTSALDKHKATENARVILALLSVGADPRNVGGYDLVSALCDTGWVCRSTLNNPIYALIALDACGVGNDEAKEALVDYILGRQLGDGGWALSGTRADPDVTAMALAALCHHRNHRSVTDSAARAINSLSAIQLEDGGYRSWGRENSESISQVTIALCAWGIDPSKDPRFIKNGITALDALLSYSTDNGFADAAGTNTSRAVTNRMATEQAVLALVAFRRLTHGGGSIYDFG